MGFRRLRRVLGGKLGRALGWSYTLRMNSPRPSQSPGFYSLAAHQGPLPAIHETQASEQPAAAGPAALGPLAEPVTRVTVRPGMNVTVQAPGAIRLFVQSPGFYSLPRTRARLPAIHETQAEELNTIVGNAFRMAYAARLQRSCLAGPGSAGDDSAWEMESRTTTTRPTTAPGRCRRWPGRPRTEEGPRSKHREPSRRELSRGKNVNLASPAAAAPAAPGGSDPAGPSYCCPLLAGYVNEAPARGREELPLVERSSSASTYTTRGHERGLDASCAATTSRAQPGAGGERSAAWFQAGIPREIALEALPGAGGAFMVRESTTKHGCYALSLRVPRDFQVSGIAHYLILKTAKGYKIKGFMKEFTSLTALITHHSVMPELLPCTLSLSRYNPNFVRSESAQDLVELDTDSEYNGLSELSRATADTSV
ncbi:tensin-2-like [Pollicipes pollicipes]|uniref:tensin-2-like n=1 Tax=Pollicipes pollicipes TaxID=41117 RepID=UPI00188549BC|nr:tensin-2-like [Pollicipes pollicipes]